MAFDFGYIIVIFVLAYIIAVMYKKKTGQNISELWKGAKENVSKIADKEGYRKVYITRGIKQ